jgi:4-hydroxy-tetrahydrodipicolinate reductase
MLRIMIVGASGRMGREVVRAAAGFADLKITAAIEKEGHPDLGKDAGTLAGIEALGAVLTANMAGGLMDCDAVIDFSLPGAAADLFQALVQTPRPAVVGTTALDGDARSLAEKASARAPILISPNLSLGVAALKSLTRHAARFLEGFDVEVMEIHHRGKVDAPSGTAGALLGVLEEGGGKSALFGRHGKDARRKAGEIGVHALRGGSVTGEHTVFFFGDGERLELRHVAESRKIFALGALGAARWLAARKPGLYTMDDIFP